MRKVKKTSYQITKLSKPSLFNFMLTEIKHLKQSGKFRTAESYMTALRSFCMYRNNKDIRFKHISTEIMGMYEIYLQNKGVSKNTSSHYMRVLRAVYNRAVEKRLTLQRYPFKKVYTGVDKTIKRAIPIDAVKRIKHINLKSHPHLEFARDMFLFSFYTRGMSFIDMAYLQKRDLNGNILIYRRHKTKQILSIKWEKCMQDIIDKYAIDEIEYLLPIIKYKSIESRKQYLSTLRLVNYNLKKIANIAGIQIPLSTYVARHAWASIAREQGIPINVISNSLGHDSESTTQIYLSTLDTAAVDKANAQILRRL